ncbi:hypothetical protein Bca4012_010545 [Brassica carinata]
MVGKSTPKGSRSEIAAGRSDRRKPCLCGRAAFSSAYMMVHFCFVASPWMVVNLDQMTRRRRSISVHLLGISYHTFTRGAYPANCVEHIFKSKRNRFRRSLPQLAKLIGSLLCRQLVTTRLRTVVHLRNHSYSLLAGRIRDVTGLNCRAFDVEDSKLVKLQTARCGIAF